MVEASDALQTVASAALYHIFKNEKPPLPVSSSQLFARVVAFKPPVDLLPAASPPRFRLLDLPKFETILEKLSQAWDKGSLSIAHDHGQMTIMQASLGSESSTAASSTVLISRKRKRVDEDADSASGAEDNETEDELPITRLSAFASLSRELKEVYAILQAPTAKGRLLAEQFHSHDESFDPICAHITRAECAKARGLSPDQHSSTICDRVHFRPLIRPHTDLNLGHCSYLNTCYSEPTYAQSPSTAQFNSVLGVQPNTRGPASLPSGLGAGGRGKERNACKYVHFEVDWDERNEAGYQGKRITEVVKKPHRIDLGLGPDGRYGQQLPPQWIHCDLRRFDYSVLGKFHVIMADPPWDIHMNLPYGTMTDDEMRAMPIPTLQDEGFLFLWVTGRALEVGRECLRAWGYTRVDEVVWVKLNQLQRVIRTGRTGHWLNHTKEHMLVAVKTVTDSSGKLKFPAWANRGLDTDVIVAEVRETSRKPDEVYGLIERLCPGGRKIEIFGRKHNTRPGWLTLGNQLGHDQIIEEDLLERVQRRYPERFDKPQYSGMNANMAFQ